MFGNIDAPQLLIILAIVIMIFGVGKLPQAAGSLGKAMKEFRKETQRTTSEDDDVEEAVHKKKRIANTRKLRDVKIPEKFDVVGTSDANLTTSHAGPVIEEKDKEA